MPSDASPGPPALAASAVYSATLVRSTCGMKYSGSALSSTMTLAPAPDSSVPSRLTRSRTSSGPIRFIGGASTTTLSTPSPPGATRSVRYTWVITASLVVGMTLMIPSAGSPPWRTLVVSLERAEDAVPGLGIRHPHRPVTRRPLGDPAQDGPARCAVRGESRYPAWYISCADAIPPPARLADRSGSSPAAPGHGRAAVLVPPARAARVAPYHQDLALTRPDRGEQPVEHGAFAVAVGQPRHAALPPGVALMSPSLPRISSIQLGVIASGRSRPLRR